MKLTIGYFADGEWSHKAFEKIIIDKNIEIRFICVRFDTKDTTLQSYCNKYNIPYLKHKNINSKEFLLEVRTYNCDLFVSMSFNQIFKKEIINIPKLKIINCHAGKLPFYRGRNILNWALINDEKCFGITIHYVDEGIDTGDIILQKEYKITDGDNYQTLLLTAHTECANLLYEAIDLFKKDQVKRIKQADIHPIGFYCSQRKEGDEILNWKQSSRDIFNFVRALSFPGPQARTFLNNKEMKINKVELIENALEYKCITGAILAKKDTSVIVKTEDSFIEIVEFEYKHTFKVGDRFEIR